MRDRYDMCACVWFFVESSRMHMFLSFRARVPRLLRPPSMRAIHGSVDRNRLYVARTCKFYRMLTKCLVMSSATILPLHCTVL